jgi:hypothetical protein
MTTRTLRRLPLCLTVLLAAATLGGCVFHPYARDARDPASAAASPRGAGKVRLGPEPKERERFAWISDVMPAAGR